VKLERPQTTSSIPLVEKPSGTVVNYIKAPTRLNKEINKYYPKKFQKSSLRHRRSVGTFWRTLRDFQAYWQLYFCYEKAYTSSPLLRTQKGLE